MKVIILGNGQLGSYIYNHWNKFNNIQINVIDYPIFDITNIQMCQQIVKENDIIINCAAYTLVDKAQSDIKNCMLINSIGPLYLALYCKNYNKKLIHISTQSVYGSNDSEYKPLNQQMDKMPVNVYAKSKMLGDQAIINIMNKYYIILRAAWLFGPNNNHNFIQKIKMLLKNKEEIKVVTDQIGSLTSVKLILNVIKKYIDGNIPDGIYNVANEGYTSRYDNAVLIKNIINSNCNIVPCLSLQFKRDADVSKNSCLDCSKLKKYYKEKILSWQVEVTNLLNGEL